MNMKEKLLKEISVEDFLIRVRPFSDKEGKWSGEVDITIMSMPENPLYNNDYDQLMHFTKMMCASVPIMEQIEDLRTMVHEYVLNVVDNDVELDVELEKELGVEKTYDGNIVHLNFNSKTKGSA